MNYVLVFITIVIFLFLSKSLRTKLERYFYFITGGYICTTLLISLSNPYDLYDVSTWTYLYLTLGFLCFWIGYISMRKRHGYDFTIDPGSMLDSLLSSKVLWMIYVVSLLLMLSLAVTQWVLIRAQGAMWNLKVDAFEVLFGNNSLLYFVYQCIAFPMFYLCVVLFSYSFINKGVSKKSLLCLFYALIFCYVGGKRGYFQTLIEIFVIIYVVHKLNNGQRLLQMLKSSYKVFFMLFVVYLGAAYMTSLNSDEGLSKQKLRESGDENAKNLVIYNVGAYRAFDYALRNNYFLQCGGYHYGRATVGGCVEYYVTNIASRLGLGMKTVREQTMLKLQDDSIYIGKDIPFNFLYTSFMYFYFDFGFIGILLFSYLFGRFTKYSIVLYESDRSMGSLAFLSYMFVSCILFPAGWFNVSLSAQPTLLLFYLIRKIELSRASKNSYAVSNEFYNCN